MKRWREQAGRVVTLSFTQLNVFCKPGLFTKKNYETQMLPSRVDNLLKEDGNMSLRENKGRAHLGKGMMGRLRAGGTGDPWDSEGHRKRTRLA